MVLCFRQYKDRLFADGLLVQWIGQWLQEVYVDGGHSNASKRHKQSAIYEMNMKNVDRKQKYRGREFGTAGTAWMRRAILPSAY